MLIIKAYSGDGAWQLWEADRVSFLGPDQSIEVPVDAEPDYDEFPATGSGDETFLFLTRGESGPVRYMRWVQWERDGGHVLLITDGPVFICNDAGDTIEALR